MFVDKGRIVVDEACQTNVPGVYAAGDVNGRWMLAHVAYREAEVIVNTLLGKKDAMRYDAVPSVIYTSPEVGCVGETEESCQAKGIDYRVATLPMNYSGRYMAENADGNGICKILIDPAHPRLIGCHLIGSYASSRTPPRLMRTNLRPVALAIDWPSEVLPTPGGPTRQRIGALSRSTRCCTARYSMMRSLTFSSPQ